MVVDMRASYTAANAIPVKLFLHGESAQLRPIHVNWLPTNRCNLNCPFCSCAKRDKGQEMPLMEALKVIHDFGDLGCKAVTITGGGEPLCHPHLTEMIEQFVECGMDVGLVTNGLLLDRLNETTLGLLTWCRVSNADHRQLTNAYQNVLDRATQVPIDWAFSHVVGPEPNLEEIERIVKYADRREFTHVRLVGDLRQPTEVSMQAVRARLRGIDERVIYQPRKEYVASNSCLAGYVKPVVGPDFKMYLCCGVQYALAEPSDDLPEELCMGDARDLGAVYRDPKPFKVPCVRCYYQAYNDVLHALTSQIKHGNFV